MQAVALRRPAEPSQQRLGIEDDPLRRRGPLVLHETNDEYGPEPAVYGCPRVDEVHAGGTGLRPEGASLDPAAHRRGEIVEARGRVVDRIVRARQLLQTLQDGVCGPPFASGGGRGRRLGDPMPPQERRQQLELRRRRTGILELLQLRGERGGHRGGSRRPGVYSFVAPAVAARRLATGRQRGKRLPAAAEPDPVQQAVERVDLRAGRRTAGMLEQKVRRPQQRHGGRPAVAGAHELDDEIERRRIRLGRQRERIAGLKRYAGLREHLACEIQVRQRPLEHDRGGGGVRFDSARRAAAGLQHARRLEQLVLAVATDEVELFAVAGRDNYGRGGGGRLETFFVNARQAVEQPLVIAGGEHGIGRDDVDPLQALHPCQQVEVGRPQAVGIGCLVRQRHHGADDRPRQSFRDQPPPQCMLVATSRSRAPPLERAERGGQETGLQQQAPRSAVNLGARFEVGPEEALEAVHALPLPQQVVVETHDGGGQARPRFERRRACLQDFARRSLHEHVPLDSGQQGQRRAGSCSQRRMPALARQQMRQGGGGGPFERAPELIGRGARRYDHHGVARPATVELTGERDNRLPETVQAGGPDKASAARRDQLGSVCGRERAARSNSIRAPAAAAAESHAARGSAFRTAR